MLGIPVEEAKAKETIKGSTHGWYWTYIKTYLDLYIQNRQWEQVSLTLTLGIYGLILFPRPLRVITHSVTEMFWVVKKQNVNPIPTILAETLLTLTYCRQQGKGTIKCYFQLLHLWILSHICPLETKGLTWYPNQPLIEKMTRLTISPKNELQWQEQILSFNSHNYYWRKLWSVGQPILSSTGDNHLVPLIGLTGYTSYIPALVIRQFGSTQLAPNVEVLHQAHFFHEPGKEEELKSFRKSWEKVTMIERSPKGLSTMEDYLRWRASRDQGYPIFEPAKPKCNTPHREVLSKEVNVKLVSSLQSSNAKNQRLQERIRQFKDR
ncbi:uncharacterized protein LOC131180608 [Hevea brasiliensis]|uniref:uncharacterized protein LOC131180608 n=1 Tax=Hevea brasiliensis TaxID=3981 RepID=UPI0025EA26C7|nr:uncharacterized protein LOC131180608 [Hevea brasiliensis]